MTTLLTGGNGWLPCHVLRRLARRGEQVISYDLLTPDEMLMEFLGEAAENVIFKHGDVTDAAHLRSVVEELGVDRIIHAAAITPRVDREQEEPERIIQVNLMSTVACLEIMRSTPRVTRMVVISSGAAWGSGHETDVLDEDSVSLANGLYGITKHTAERFSKRYRELFGIDVVCVRPGSVYGPMERHTPGYRGATELREMLRIISLAEPLAINSLESPYHDWTFVEDVAEGIERAWETPNLPHDVYSISSGVKYPIGDMLAAFKRHWPGMEYFLAPEAESNYVVQVGPKGPDISTARLEQDFGWKPSTSLDDGVSQYLDWIRTYGPQ
ncbi:MAG: NAD(P)-dependent oxidoreductase [Chloroflexia bacterium]|nr:NAD(P)-dependent oxidoreductase [Chloroflexia bacterium]